MDPQAPPPLEPPRAHLALSLRVPTAVWVCLCIAALLVGWSAASVSAVIVEERTAIIARDRAAEQRAVDAEWQRLEGERRELRAMRERLGLKPPPGGWPDARTARADSLKALDAAIDATLATARPR